MKKIFSLFNDFQFHQKIIETIYECVKITLGPSGKNGLVLSEKQEMKVITNGSLLLKALSFSTHSGTILLQLFQQASFKTAVISGDGSTLTLLFTCQLLLTSFRFITNGFNVIFLSNGLKKISYFLNEKVLEFSVPVLTRQDLEKIFKTNIGQKLNKDLSQILITSLQQINRDGLLFVEENNSAVTEIENIQGIELDKGFASSYFINNVKSFEVSYENPYVLISPSPLDSLNQIQLILEFIKTNNRPLVIVVEEINKELLSTLVLNTIKKKIKVVVIKYTSIKFMKNGLLEDLALLTHSNYFISNLSQKNVIFKVEDLGQAEKVIVKKSKSTFFISKFSKLVANRRINELNRDLLTSESDYEKNIFKTRIARLSGNIAKIKIGLSNQYEIDEIRQKVEQLVQTLKSSLEEGFLPGGGSFYLFLKEELKLWSSVNLFGDEIFAAQIVSTVLSKPFEELIQHSYGIKNKYLILEELKEKGYPYSYDIFSQKIVHTLDDGLIDSSKSVRGTLWNSLNLVSTILTSE
jgi:chaperonin GroEL